MITKTLKNEIKFLKDYEALCKKHNVRFANEPLELCEISDVHFENGKIVVNWKFIENADLEFMAALTEKRADEIEKELMRIIKSRKAIASLCYSAADDTYYFIDKGESRAYAWKESYCD